MQDWPDDLIAELSNQPTTLCRLFVVEPVALPALYFTDHDQDVTLGGHTYRADHSFQPSAIENSIGGANTNLELTVLFATSQIAYDDAIRGLYQGATVTALLASYGNIAAGSGVLTKGRIGSFNLPSKLYGIMSINGGTGKMDREMTEVYTSFCRADFGDTRCGIDIEAHGFNFTVSSLPDDMSLITDVPARHADGFYNLGSLSWVTGDNAGVVQEVAFSLATGVVGLFYPPPFAMAPGDTGRLYQGCAKTLTACVAYANLPNFRGEPYVPGDDDKAVI